MNAKVTKELKELRDAVNQASEHTKRQFETIDTSNLLTTLFSLLLGLGIAYWLKISLYWIPASFVIMYLWGLKGFSDSKKSFSPKKVEEAIQIKSIVSKEQINHGIEWLLKNVENFAKATTIVYGISFFVLLAISTGWVKTETHISILVPILACLIYLPTPFLINNTKKFFQKSIGESFDFLGRVKTFFGSGVLSVLLGILFILFVLFYILGVLLLPAWAFIITFVFIKEWLFFVIILIVQLFVIMVLSSYFSGMTVKRELSNAMTNFSDINYQINNILLKGECAEQDVKNLKRLYQTAKHFDLLIDDSFKFVNIYYLIMNRVYIKEITVHEESK